jgi:hypothetical protein
VCGEVITVKNKISLTYKDVCGTIEVMRLDDICMDCKMEIDKFFNHLLGDRISKVRTIYGNLDAYLKQHTEIKL